MFSDYNTSSRVILGSSLLSSLIFAYYFYFSRDKYYHAPASTFQTLAFTNICIYSISGFYIDQYLTSSRKRKNSALSSAFKVGRYLLFLLSTSVIFSVAAVLFGAPIFSSYHSTFTFALNCSTLSISPIFWLPSCKFDEYLDILLFNGDLNYTTLLSNTAFWSTAVGAWLGSFAIPLDWDRPWQTWPISCVLSAHIIHSCSMLILAAISSIYTFKAKKD